MGSTINQEPTQQPVAEKRTVKSPIPKILTAIAFAAATAIGAHKCASSHNSPEVSDFSVASSLGDVERLAETIIEGNSQLPEATNEKQALQNYLTLNSLDLTAADFEKAFAGIPEHAPGNNKYIEVMQVSEIQQQYAPNKSQWTPVRSRLSNCDISSCIYAIRVKKDRYRNLLSFRKEHKPRIVLQDKADPNIVYIAFEKEGYSSINVINPANPKSNLHLTRIAMKPANLPFETPTGQPE